VNAEQETRLIRAAQSGDEQAFARLYDEHVDKIYRYVLYRVDNSETAQDLTGEVFLQMVEGLPRYEHRGKPLLAWLYRIAHARVVDYFRQSRQSRDETNIDDLEYMDAGGESVDDTVFENFQHEQVRRALRMLSSDHQQVILFRFVEGYNLEQTADMLNKTVGAVKVMQHRAVHALSRALEKLESPKTR
jgi:RNA polymerase sigma-70 factor, ECF subfamily